MRTQLQEENTWLRRKFLENKSQLATMASLSMEALQCRLPSKSYEPYLKDQWMQFQIKTLAQQGTMPFQDYMQLIKICDKSTLEDKAKLSELYVHNLSLTDLNVWDPNANLGNLQLMALASWMTHEEARAEEVKRIVEKEERDPLYTIAEHINSMDIITTTTSFPMMLNMQQDT